ncbi:MAG: acyl-CoA dehydrogenase [Acidimicrobiia bacterium]|nr:acyl-CoA dehydrogenase [Acidimicrobiia bacterium]
MSIAITEEHLELQQAARRWVESHCPPAVPRSLLDAESETMPPFWEDLAGLGWLGLHVDEAYGGEGYGLAELAVVLEELGRACAPGPFLPTVLTAAVVQASGREAAAKALLPGLATGESTGAVALGPGLRGVAVADGLRVSGTTGPVLGGHLASIVVAPVSTPDGDVWVALEAARLTAREMRSVDRTRRVAGIEVDGAVVPAERQLLGLATERVRDLAAVLASAEAVGLAGWCVDTAAAYATERHQFGRPIGQFQGVKHRCADMLCAAELARGAVWDAARGAADPREGPLAVAVAAAVALEAGLECAKSCIQVLGGIGFTWEHDAHCYLRRATTSTLLLGGGPAWRRRAVELALGGARRHLPVDLPPEADAVRAEVRAFVDEIRDLDDASRRARMVEEGYLKPEWPRPYGRDAGALEQLVIAEELRTARIRVPSILIGGWALPPVMVFGTQEQQERWIWPTLRGEISWCQLFSEPGAGSDLASLSTRATRVDGGFLLNGQKVWTSMAHTTDWGICLVRTDPEAPKHQGISCLMVDMRSPGIDVRPLRELTGEAMFNEVFFDDVFVPDDCLVGELHGGWAAARTTLANERVFMGGGASFGFGVEALLEMVRSAGLESDGGVVEELGALLCEAQALAVLGFRLTLRALSGADPGAESSVRKLLGAEHDQAVQEMGLRLLGAAAATGEGDAATWIHGFLFDRCLTIAGGTSEIQRNVIGERLLGLPKDP